MVESPCVEKCKEIFYMKSINGQYELAHKHFKALDWWMNESLGMTWFFQGHLSAKFDPLFHKMLDQKFKELYPRKKKIVHKDIPQEYIDEIKAEIMPKVHSYATQKRKQYDLLNNWLYANARNVSLIADEQIIYKSDFANYSSQGYGMERYSQSACQRIADILTERGIANRVTPCYHDKNYNIVVDIPDGKRCAFRHRTSNHEVSEREKHLYPFGYCVVAPLTEYMLDAILRSTQQSLLEWAISCWKTGTNPKVMNPFLPDDIYEESSRLARDIRNDR